MVDAIRSGRLSYFNTSHVLIYHLISLLFFLIKIISIHLMFLFIAMGNYYASKYTAFQYISCSYLSEMGEATKEYRSNFNTSHVLIYHILLLQWIFKIKYFNTSHVLIYPVQLTTTKGYGINFNTSHVLIYRIKCILNRLSSGFQYISCSYLSYIRFTNIKTFYISIHLMFLFIVTENEILWTNVGISIHLMFLFIVESTALC